MLGRFVGEYMTLLAASSQSGRSVLQQGLLAAAEWHPWTGHCIMHTAWTLFDGSRHNARASEADAVPSSDFESWPA